MKRLVPYRGSPNTARAALVTAFVTGAVVMGLYWIVVHKSETMSGDKSVSALFPTTLDPDDPTQPLLTDGVLVALPQAQVARAFAIYRPQHSMASDESMTQIWIDASEVALRYSSGVRVYLRRWPPGKDPATSYAAQAQDVGVGTVAEIKGHPAWVAEANALSPGNPRYTFVDMSIGNVQILLAANMALADLTEIASTVQG